jgi:hypothetical protein
MIVMLLHVCDVIGVVAMFVDAYYFVDGFWCCLFALEGSIVFTREG